MPALPNECDVIIKRAWREAGIHLGCMDVCVCVGGGGGGGGEVANTALGTLR